MRFVKTTDAPAPAGHYSQGVIHGGVVYVAGQLPNDPDNPDAPPGDAESQTRQALANVAAVLQAAGSGLDQVLQMTIYVSDISVWGDVNRAYADVMGSHRPARAVVPAGELHYGYVVEIQAIAAVAEKAGNPQGGTS